MRNILIISLILNAALVSLVTFRTKPSSNETARNPVPANTPDAAAREKQSAPLVAVATNAAPALFDWRVIESTNYNQYIANLRAIGCPEQTIRDLIITDLDRTYAQRQRKLRSDNAKNYWQAWNPTAQTRESVELKRIEEEKRGVIRELLGIDADEEATRRAGRPVDYEEGFEFLSAEKQMQLREIDHEYQLKLLASDGAMPYGQIRDQQADAIRRKEIEEWKDAAIKKLLTPVELNEYEMRRGAHAHQLLWRTVAFEPSEQEFRSIFQIEKQFGKINPVTTALEPPVDPILKQQFEAALQQALGEQRYADYQRTQDPNYANLYSIVRDVELPKETTQIVYDLNRAAEQQAEAIRKDTSLSPEARQAAFQRLGAATDREIAKFLGETGSSLYQIRIGNQRTYGWR